MEILIVVCLAVLVSVFIVKFCIKGESGGSEKDSGALYYSEKTEDIVEKTEKSLEAFCCEVIKDEKEKIKKTEVPIKTGLYMVRNRHWFLRQPVLCHKRQWR